KSREQASHTEPAKQEKSSKVAFKVGDTTLRDHIDPIGEATSQHPGEGHKDSFDRTIRGKESRWTDGVDTFDELPTGEDLSEPDEDEKSKVDRLRAKAFDNIDTFKSETDKVAKVIDSVFGLRPSGQTEVRSETGPAVADADHPGIDPGSAVSAF